MANIVFTEEQRKFIRENAKLYYFRKDLADALNEKFNSDITPSQIKDFLKRNKLKLKQPYHEWTEEEVNFLKEALKKHSKKEAIVLFNNKFSEKITLAQLKRLQTKYNITAQNNGRLKKNHSLNQSPIGTETIWTQGNYKYIGIKIKEPSVWVHKHIYVWEKEYGTLPDSQVVIFLDGNTLNCELDNLMAIDKRINVIMNRNRLPRGSKEETICSIAIAKLMATIVDVEKNDKKETK